MNAGCSCIFFAQIFNVSLQKHLIKRAQPLPHRRPGDQPKKVRTLADSEVRKEVESVYQNYRAVMRNLAL
jgi:hypothetical protein